MLGAVCLEARVTGERGGAGNSRINREVIRLSSDFWQWVQAELGGYVRASVAAESTDVNPQSPWVWLFLEH